MNIIWDSFDSQYAEKQGWDIFYNTGSGIYEIERIDEMEMFPDDFAVVTYLTREALRGNFLAIKALAINWQQVYENTITRSFRK